MVRPSYRANFTSGTGDSANPAADPFFALVFDATEPDFNGPVSYDRDDLLGGYPAPRRYVGWQTFFDFGDGQVKNNKKIDTTISSVLFTLPVPGHRPAHPDRAHGAAAAQPAPPAHLEPALGPGRRAQPWACPPLTAADLADIGAVYAPFATSTPLWYYVLAEAKIAADGLNLGPVGGRIVTETLIGLLRADPASYLPRLPRFTPFLGTDLPAGAQPRTPASPETAATPAPTSCTTRASSPPGTYR